MRFFLISLHKAFKGKFRKSNQMFAGTCNLFPNVRNFRYICTIVFKFHKCTYCTNDTQNVVKQSATVLKVDVGKHRYRNSILKVLFCSYKHAQTY